MRAIRQDLTDRADLGLTDLIRGAGALGGVALRVTVVTVVTGLLFLPPVAPPPPRGAALLFPLLMTTLRPTEHLLWQAVERPEGVFTDVIAVPLEEGAGMAVISEEHLRGVTSLRVVEAWVKVEGRMKVEWVNLPVGAEGGLVVVRVKAEGGRKKDERVTAMIRVEGPRRGATGPSTYTFGEKLVRSVVKRRSCHGHAVHPTQKPVDLLELLIRYSCPPGGVVLDPFVGSGSTLIAAVNTGRKAIGIDASKAMCELTVKRYLTAAPADLYQQARET